ncbi:DUF4157 domain-containing protein [Mariniflexile gromovii]|uniref:DUF4157 domain-containing protein n=1 Tax=Mariniflexile gromovii TaxID=362523 RepID=A0ABS4BVV0_9FLAO|nr:DUF4157 domain-containing protein [Mariniflexile gromovii]MBP0904182.1 DUF4157 domain-containing protein [Mariniflexile gromovii]
MEVAEVQKKSSTAQNQIQLKRQPFFNKDGKDGFFSKSNENQTPEAFFSPTTVQPKLTIGQPNDKYEVEADTMADKVVQRLSSSNESANTIGYNGNTAIQAKCSECEEEEKLQKKEEVSVNENNPIQLKPIFESNAEQPESEIQTKLISSPVIQPKCAHCEEDEKLQKKEHEELLESDTELQKKEASADTNEAPNLEERLNSSKGKGSSLPSDLQNSMGSEFGADFSNVKVHTCSESVQMNKELGAQAFTHGNDIYFNQGKYDTNSNSGKHLLAHELTHTVQQGASVMKKPDVQLEEEVDKEELERQIKESNKEQKDAFDPSEAIKTQNEAVKEGEQAELMANEGIPVVEPPKPEPLPEASGSNGSRVAIPVPKKPDVVVPASQKKKEPKPEQDSAVAEPNVNEEANATGTETTEAPLMEKGGETLEYLETQSAGVCNEGAKKSQELADNESAHDTAEEKTTQTDVAVEPPLEEGQSLSNAEQINTLEEAEEPKANDAEIKSEMDKAISDAVPSKVKELNEFESEKKAQVIGNKVLAGTTKQVGEIQGTYNEIETPPAPAESEIPEALPEIESAPDTSNLNLGKGAVPAVPIEQTDLSNFEEEADGIYEKEGVSKDMQAEFENVDSGDIAEANKEKTTLKEKVATEPANLQNFAAEQQSKVETDLQKEEEKARGSMEEQRNNELNGAKIEQEKTKSELELKRENVTKWINDRYKLAEDVVKEKLSNLETQALNTFDNGQKTHSIAFENNVKRRVNAWKSDRYSGFWGGAKWLKDKFVGIDHFPAIKEIFTSERETFVKAIDLLIIDINAENEKTIKSCKEEIVTAKKEIQKYIDELGPELKEAGKRGQEETTKKLEALDKHVEDEKKKLQQKLCDKKDEAMKAIDKKIEEMKSEMSGLVGKLGALLLYAAKKFFKWAIEKLGGSPDKIISLLDKGATVLKKLFTDPIGFFKNLVKAVGGGIKGFVTNIVSWLKKGLVGWLMGQMGDSGLELPQKFDMKGILFLGLQVAGLTWNVIRPKIVKGLGAKGETIMAAAEKGVDIIKRVVKEGPIALWDIIMEKAGEIKTKVMEGIRNWAVTQIIKKMSVKLLSMLNPAGAIVQAIMLLYDVVMFFVENWDRIIDFVKSVFDSIGAIASGAIGQAAGFVEKTLGKTIPMILSFAARFVGLSGIGKAIRKVIETIQKPFKAILDKMVKFLVKQVSKLFGKGKGKGKDGKDKKDDKNILKDKEVGEKISFNVGGESHKIWIDTKNGVEIMVASTRMTIKGRITKWDKKVSDLPEEKKEKAKKMLQSAGKLYESTKVKATTAKKEIDQATKNPSPKEISEATKAYNVTEKEEKRLMHEMTQLFEIFGDENGVMARFDAYLKKIDPNVKLAIYDAIEKNSKNLKDVKEWPVLVEKLKGLTPSTKSLFSSPMDANSHSFGKKLVNNQASNALTTALSDQKEKKKQEVTSKKKEFINNRVPIIHGGQTARAMEARTAIVDQITDKNKQKTATNSLTTYYKESLQGNITEEHDKFTPKVISVRVDKGSITIEYTYEVEINGRNEIRKFFSHLQIAQVNGTEGVDQITYGRDLVLKIPKTRGRTESVNQEEANRALKDSDSHVANKEIGFDASHVLADTFLGSGYKNALNLVTTSADYNRKTMKTAEEYVKKQIKKVENNLKKKNPEDFVTFDLTVLARWNPVTDSEIVKGLKSANAKMTSEQITKLREMIASDKDPKLCQGVTYMVNDIKKNGTKSIGANGIFTEIGPDTTLSKILINKKK